MGVSNAFSKSNMNVSTCPLLSKILAQYYIFIFSPKSNTSKRCRQIANSVDPDQTAKCLHCLPRPVCLKTLDHCCIITDMYKKLFN